MHLVIGINTLILGSSIQVCVLDNDDGSSINLVSVKRKKLMSYHTYSMIKTLSNIRAGQDLVKYART